MTYFAHTDFYNYYLKEIKKNNKQTNQEKILKKMFEELMNISKNDLIIPTYNFDFVKTKKFNFKKDRSYVGSFSEMFRNKFKKNRTLTPMFSTCRSISKINFYKNNYFDPFGKHSEFNYLVKKKGKILNFGAEFAPSFIMFIERSIKHGALYRYGKFFIGKTFKKGKYTKCKLYFEVRPKQINIEYDLKKLKKNLLRLKIMKIKKTSNNFTYEEIDAKQFLSFGLKNLKKNPYFFLKKNTINELKKKKLFHFKKFKIKEFE